ncbi:Putative E3 ubiquitin-protein ligase LIN-1 [Linum grandiflorum]
MYEILNKKRGVKYRMLKNVILEQLLVAISTSKEERVIRASVSILSTIVLVNKSAVEEIKRKGLRLLYDLATALKKSKVHEAAILIYLINPSPTQIKTLQLLPALLEVLVSSSVYKDNSNPGRSLTPPAASLMIMEVLVTAFDCDTNNMHLAAIVSPQILTRLVEVAKDRNLDEHVSLAKILVKCMQFDGCCRRYISESIPLEPFTCLLQRREKQAKLAALEFFQEILCIPRSSATRLLQRIQKGIGSNHMQIVMDCVHELQTDHQLLAANLLLQLDNLQDNSSRKSKFSDEALEVILEGLSNEESSTSQQLSAYVLANIGGTYSWSGEPNTVAWLAKKGGLTSLTHRNLMKNFNPLDQTLQITKRVMEMGKPVFQALAGGLRSKIRRVRLNSLTAIAWIGCEIGKYPNSIRHSACDILLSGLEHSLHPGLELEERFLACMSIYNYASGKGMQKLINFSEGVRESLRRFSSITWMAEELHRVADYYLPNTSRISCVHTQVLEAKHSSSGAVTALIYYKGFLFSGYSDGTIKGWDIKNQTATVAYEMKEHRKVVTCFSLFEQGESLLSSSADKTIRVWKMVGRKLECVEVISTNELIRKLGTYGHMVYAITQSHGIKVIDSSRKVRDMCKSKKAKCMSTVVQGKIYVGCTDASIQEVGTASKREREIKAPVKNWMMQTKPINSIIVYKDWLYTAGSLVEGSKVKEWRTNCKQPQISMVAEKGMSVLAMEVVEDFIYLNCSSCTSTLQIWLRGTQQKVGRISAGSRVTSLLCANDVVLCGTEKGLIKGWIPL